MKSARISILTATTHSPKRSHLKQQLDTAEANWKVAVAQQQSARHKLDELQRGYRPEKSLPQKRTTIKPRPTWKNSSAATVAKTSTSPKQPTLTTKPASASARSPLPPPPSSSLDVRPATSSLPIRPSPLFSKRSDLRSHLHSRNRNRPRQAWPKSRSSRRFFSEHRFRWSRRTDQPAGRILPRNVQTAKSASTSHGIKIRINDPAGRVLAAWPPT